MDKSGKPLHPRNSADSLLSYSKISSLSAQLNNIKDTNTNTLSNVRDQYEDEDEDAVFAELEAEIENDDNSAMREHGLQMLKREMQSVQTMRQNEHGQYTEIMDEKEVIRVSAREPRCVVHFYHTKFKRCEIMDKHLAKLAPKYFNTRFARVFVENIPWLVEKLGIKVLPCIICFIDGVAKERLIGFEELGNVDGFETAVLELRLSSIGVIQKQKNYDLNQIYKVSSSRSQEDNDDEVFDLDD